MLRSTLSNSMLSWDTRHRDSGNAQVSYRGLTPIGAGCSLVGTQRASPHAHPTLEQPPVPPQNELGPRTKQHPPSPGPPPSRRCRCKARPTAESHWGLGFSQYGNASPSSHQQGGWQQALLVILGEAALGRMSIGESWSLFQ